MSETIRASGDAIVLDDPEWQDKHPLLVCPRPASPTASVEERREWIRKGLELVMSVHMKADHRV